MRPNWKTILATTVLALAVTPAFAAHAGGRITFQGAIVTPTCSVPTAWHAPDGATTQQQGCSNATRNGLKAQAVHVHAMQLSDRQVAGLLHPFAVQRLAAVDGHAHTVLVQYNYR